MIRLLIRGAAVCVAVLVVFGSLSWLAHSKLTYATPDGQVWIYWFQVVSGNWAPSAESPVKGWSFAISAVIAVFLNNALLILVASYFWRFSKMWRARMQLGQAFVTRDQMNKQAIFRMFELTDPVSRERVNQAFKEGEEAWQKNLAEVFGEEKAAKIIELLYEEV